MADNGRPPSSVTPAAARDQRELNRKLLEQAQGRAGQFFGKHWRAVEAGYPTADDAICLHFQVRTKDGWTTRAVVTAAGVITGVP